MAHESNNTTDGIDASSPLADLADQTLAHESLSDILARLPITAMARQPQTATPETQVAALQSELDQEREAHLRARADFANFKRRTDEERERMRAFVGENILAGLLPIVDNFERAVQAANTTQDYEKLIGGVNAILRQMQEFLAKNGVETGKADAGDPFDPNFHNAVLRAETTEYPENAIVEELQKGYTLGGRVLRPAMVKVATGAE
jgi:molecular chaperone GrpE